jgi:hypothetical protein
VIAERSGTGVSIALMSVPVATSAGLAWRSPLRDRRFGAD